MVVKVKDILACMDDFTNGRCLKGPGDWASGKNPYVVTKTSGIPGKAVTELPGLVWGDPEKEVKKIAIGITMTESQIELAAATGCDAIMVHHPIAEASNSGGVLIKDYLGMYGISAFECHEAFHGLHPGIAWLHGHKSKFCSICYGGVQGNVVNVGDVLPEIKTLGDMITRLEDLMDKPTDMKMLEAEREIRGCADIQETAIAACAKILVGTPDTPMKEVIHIHPHTGFNTNDLERIKADWPNADTLIASISHVYEGSPLLEKAKELGMNVVVGNSHGLEIFENGMPMGKALKAGLPELEVVIFRERQSSIPLDMAGSKSLQAYAEMMQTNYLHRK